MVWVIAVATYSVIAAVTLWLHARCFINVAVGFCEIKFRKARLGKARYALLNAGSHFVLPLVQRRLLSRSGEPGVVFPVARDAGTRRSTGTVFGRTRGGRERLLTEAEFTYHVEDAGAFVHDEFHPAFLPDIVAYIRARVILEEAIAKVSESKESTLIPYAIVAAFDEVSSAQNKNSHLKVEMRRLNRVCVLTELPLAHGGKRASDQ
jgi:hypothetical protein